MIQRPAPLPFMKMHGLGNDFVVLDLREGEVVVTPALARAVGDRQRGVGFDQLATIHADAEADACLVFWNADGSKAGACGNATRCIARHLMDDTGATKLRLRTERGLLTVRDAGEGMTAVNMGDPILDWREIPLSEDVDIDALPIDGAPLATGMGNPHCTFFVDDVKGVDLATFGPAHEHHPLFPQRTNVQIAHVTGPDRLRMRVWERGAGITLASGSSSCAVAVAAHRRGLVGRSVTIDLDGGTIHIDWRDDGVWMTGPTAHVFDGVLTPDWLEANS
ncbi:diaminopimelate epimerase [Palleronia marisminoris]|uniref:Diaminopimelate epimerase n=1 Tax=Palleronia marisminoris TaxID=315423 RepID=A0A1Y5TM45_9RHOB|nr:diaminopimelate epimerase [Palleronia marisminoris]SFH44062.1 diaminopimelate epimerase [Palleronia marisminoris]SLN67199.1 Diaminopimelate epimerase [Palleronia marisminoris]